MWCNEISYSHDLKIANCLWKTRAESKSHHTDGSFIFIILTFDDLLYNNLCIL